VGGDMGGGWGGDGASDESDDSAGGGSGGGGGRGVGEEGRWGAEEGRWGSTPPPEGESMVMRWAASQFAGEGVTSQERTRHLRQAEFSAPRKRARLSDVLNSEERGTRVTQKKVWSISVDTESPEALFPASLAERARGHPAIAARARAHLVGAPTPSASALALPQHGLSPEEEGGRRRRGADAVRVRKRLKAAQVRGDTLLEQVLLRKLKLLTKSNKKSASYWPTLEGRCLPQEALYLPTFSHLLIVNKLFSLSLSHAHIDDISNTNTHTHTHTHTHT